MVRGVSEAPRYLVPRMLTAGTSFQILLGGGGKCPPQAKSNFLTYFLSNFKTAENVHMFLAILDGIVILPEYILKNSHFQLEKNEIVIEY